jgi:sulfatase maturation enzyme AslB (radical SAM superfamily)
LASILNKHDQIHLSLDGYDQKSNERYRVNSDWKSISSAIDVLSGKEVRLIWDIIYFDFNYSHMEYTKSIAKNRGFDAMRITKSNKFFSSGAEYDKSLEPPEEFISSSGRFETETIHFTSRKIYNDSLKNALQRYENADKSKSIIPLCMIGTKGLFVDSQGYFYPCCWIINKYDKESYKKWLIPEKNIKKSGLESVLNSSVWQDFIKSIPTNNICNLKCKATETSEKTVVRW